MAEITAGLVKELREKTGAGMMDCKRALTESGGDMEQAIDWLRKKGLSAAAKKAGRIAAEGLVGVAVSSGAAAVVEVNAETDFVARNPVFRDFVTMVSQLAVDSGADLEQLLSLPYPDEDRTVAGQLTHLIATIGENMTVRRAAVLRVADGVVGQYVHSAQAEGLGRIGVIVAIETPAAGAPVEEFAKRLAMHIAAANPQAVSRADVDPSALDRERNILSEQARASGKPEAIIAKMVEGRLSKFYEEVCLTEQTYVIDGERKVGAVIESLAKELGAPIQVSGFVRFALGEGVEKKQVDFAAEVAGAAAAR